MSDDLVKRLRDGCNLQQRDGERAADRIEQLERDLESAAKADPMTATEILLRREIEQLDQELSEAHKDIEFLQSGKDAVRDGLQAALTAQMELADQADAIILKIINGPQVECIPDNEIQADIAAYRKARGL